MTVQESESKICAIAQELANLNLKDGPTKAYLNQIRANEDYYEDWDFVVDNLGEIWDTYENIVTLIKKRSSHG